MKAREYNFDGIVGPTHNYAGLSFGNVASRKHQNQNSSPKTAALQGLEKMKFVADLGIGQAVLPPLLRPRLELLSELGFSGTLTEMVDAAHSANPTLLAACYSASNMWTANASTVTSAADSSDNRSHFTPANLASTLHRSIEGPWTQKILKHIFSSEEHFAVHSPLPSSAALSDEGAANHTRLTASHNQPGIGMFTYGAINLDKNAPKPKRFPARQTLEACQAISRFHRLENAFFIQQNPDAIDAGVFHNDVIAVGNENVLFCHELAFVDQTRRLKELADRFQEVCDAELQIVQLSSETIGLQDVVSCYLFNSQLISRPEGMALICPQDCQENESARRAIETVLAEDNPINEVHFLDLRQSMHNGGGPACLRLRVVLDEKQQAAVHSGVMFTEELYHSLRKSIEKHYRDQLCPDDLRDPKLVDEARDAVADLAAILDIPFECF